MNEAMTEGEQWSREVAHNCDMHEYECDHVTGYQPVVPELEISIRVTYRGKVYEGRIDCEEYFCSDLARAIRLGKDPVDVIAYLADEGSKATQGTSNPARLNRVGH